MIRKFLPSDQKPLETLLVELQNELRRQDPNRALGETTATPYLNQTLDQVKNKNGQILVAEESNKIVGFISFWIEEDYSNLITKDKIYGFVSDIFLLPEYRKMGIGKELLERAEEYFRTKGILDIKLYSLASNQTANNFYEKQGFHDYENLLVKHL